MAEIMNDQNDARTVKLFGNYGDGDAIEIFGFFSETTARISRVTTNDQPENFQLSPEIMDQLAQSWMSYRADMRAQKDAQTRHIEEVEAQIQELLQDKPWIQFEADKRPHRTDYSAFDSKNESWIFYDCDNVDEALRALQHYCAQPTTTTQSL